MCEAYAGGASSSGTRINRMNDLAFRYALKLKKVWER